LHDHESTYPAPRRLAPGWAQLNIYTNTQYNYVPSQNDGMYMAVNIEPSMRYFQMNTIPCPAAYGPHIKEWVCLNETKMGETKQNRILTWDLRI
jgi:hypothetical protein